MSRYQSTHAVGETHPVSAMMRRIEAMLERHAPSGIRAVVTRTKSPRARTLHEPWSAREIRLFEECCAGTKSCFRSHLLRYCDYLRGGGTHGPWKWSGDDPVCQRDGVKRGSFAALANKYREQVRDAMAEDCRHP